MADWFGGIGKDLSGFVGEVTKSVQSQVSQLQQANEAEQKQTNQPYGAFANEFGLDSFSTLFTPNDTQQQGLDNNNNNNVPSAKDASNVQLIKSNESDIEFSDDEIQTNNNKQNNVEILEKNDTNNTQNTHQNEIKIDANTQGNGNQIETGNAVANSPKTNTEQNKPNEIEANLESDGISVSQAQMQNNAVIIKEKDSKYQQLLLEKEEGNAKYKLLKSKFGKLHGKYKQLKQENEQQQTLNEALKQAQATHESALNEMENAFSYKIDNKQEKIKHLVKDMAKQDMLIQQHNISITKYESEAAMMSNKLQAADEQLRENKNIINGLNNELMQFKQNNEALQRQINNLQTEKQQIQTQNENEKPVQNEIGIQTNQNEQNDDESEQKEGNQALDSNDSQISLEKSASNEMEAIKKQCKEEVSNWKLMYQELEKTLFEHVTQKQELSEESERLRNNLKIREEQLEKTTLKISNFMNDIEIYEKNINELKHKLQNATTTKTKTNENNDEKWKKIIAQKDKEFSEILKEGEEWASNCHNLESKIKKLLDGLTDRNEEIDDLKLKINEKEERITNLLENINAKKTDTQSIEERNKLLLKHNQDTKLENVQLMEQIIALKSKMKHVENERDEYVEMIEENKDIVNKLNMKINLERESIQSYKSTKEKEEHLLNELRELREEMQRIQSMERKKYERLQREKEDEKKLRISAEKRNEELSLEISSSTQPLLRQMESLKNSHVQRQKIWGNLEKDLRAKIRTLENDSNEKDNKMNAILTDLEDYKMRQSKMDIMNKRLKEENKSFKAKCQNVGDQYEEIQIKYEDVMNDYEIYVEKVNNLESDKKNISNQLVKFNKDYDSERNRLQNILNAENKKREELQKTITILQNKLRQFESYGVNVVNSEKISTPTKDSTDFLLMSNGDGNGNNNMWTVSRMKNELRQKENDLKSLKERLIRIQTTNDTFSDEIVKLKSQNETLCKYHNLYKHQSKQINALKLRYEAAIDIVMEKEKRIQELSHI